MDDPIRPDQDILHYDFAIVLSDTSVAIEGVAAIRYLVRGGAGPLLLDFDPALTVDSIRSAEGRLTRAEAAAPVLAIPHWGAVGDTLQVTIFYHGRPRDGLVHRPNGSGVPSVFADNWPNRARHWFPGEDHPSDKATVVFVVDVPRHWRAIANGTLIAVDTLESGRTRWRWATGSPIPTYTMVIGAGRLAVTQLASTEGVPQSVWTFPEDSAFAIQGPFDRAAEMLSAYATLIGPYPYSKLAHVESSTRFGGMENSSAIFYAEGSFRDKSLSEETVAHEIAHQWFGDAVTPRDWHHLWLSEGFASYLGPMFFELAGEAPRFRDAMERNRRVYMASAVVDRPIIDTAAKDLFGLLNENNYPKGAWVLHMLRAEVGDSVLVRGLRTFYATFRDSTVLSSDFAAVMTQAAGRPLEEFFRQWLLQPGYPKVRAAWSYQGERLTLELRQAQPEGWGAFKLRLPVRAELANGEVVDFVVRVEGAAATIERPLPARPTRLLLDPEATLLMEVVEVTERR